MVSNAEQSDPQMKTTVPMNDVSTPVEAENFYVGQHITFQGRLGIVTSVSYNDKTTLVKVFVYEDAKIHVIDVEDENQLAQVEEVS